MDQLVLSLFSKGCSCNWSKPLLVGSRNHTVLYVDKDSAFEVDFKENTLINSGSKLPPGTDFFDGYFNGCLIRLNGAFVYVIIYQDRIWKLTGDYFEGGGNSR